MLVFFPKRAIPGFAVACLAMFVGIGTGFVAAFPFFHQKNFKPGHLLFIPAICFASWYVRYLWSKGANPDKSTYVMEMPPRDMAIMLSFFLIIGIILGFLLSLPSVQNA